jgi:hypothetical protein
MTGFANDVDRYFVDLESQLNDDGIEKGSDVSKTLRRLKRVLKKEGFALAEGEQVVETKSVRKTKKTKVVTTDSAPDYVVSAFGVVNSVDADVVNSVFTEIDGWKTQTVTVKGRTFVVVTNAPRWSKKRIKSALTNLISGRQSAPV